MTAAAAGPAEMVIERDVAIPMADGVALAADVFRPCAGPPVPVIMSVGPYGKGIHFRDWQRAEWDRLITRHPEVLDGSSGEHMVWELADPERWVPHGYAVVRVDSRGAGRSPGYLDCLSPQETADFCQAIEWAAAQPWSTGKVGLCGVSYYAMSQWLAAARQPPHLAAGLAEVGRLLGRHLFHQEPHGPRPHCGRCAECRMEVHSILGDPARNTRGSSASSGCRRMPRRMAGIEVSGSEGSESRPGRNSPA